MAILDELRAAIKNSGRTQQELADAVGLHLISLNRFLNGRAGLSIEMMEKLAEQVGFNAKLVPDKRRQRRK